MTFLSDLTARPFALTSGILKGQALFVGAGTLGFEVAVFNASSRPTSVQLQNAWKARRDGRPAPVLVVALQTDRASICGPLGDQPPVVFDLDKGRVERLCRAALQLPSRHAALDFMNRALPSLETKVPGLRNEGLFALHELADNAPKRPEWTQLLPKARTAVGAKGRELLDKLGFKIEKLDNMTSLLKGRDRRLALGVLLEPSEIPEAGAPRFNNLSPVSYALSKADQEGLSWVVMAQGDRLRLYPTAVGTGVGRRGRTETFVEVQTSLLGDEHLSFLPLLFSADALAEGGSVEQLLDNSRRFAGDLAKSLRDRIYEKVVPKLAEGIIAARNLRNPTAADLDLTYRMALTVLFRLLFIAYAEDRDLLPYRLNEAYRRRSLKQKAQELADNALNLRPIAAGTTHWDEVARVWKAVAVGNSEWSVPAYDGGLFTSDRTVSPAGAELDRLKLQNEVFEPALRDLLLIPTEEIAFAPVDFRSLGVREFGTIYEGLLESELSVADQDLALDTKNSYVPVKGRAVPVVAKGQIYLHNRSGARKSSGSYFTKSFAVDHLLDRALEPALKDHLARLDELDETEAAESLFDFRVADIAMGSGHFLVAAIDRIERGFTEYLTRRQLPGIRNELLALKKAARKELAEVADQMEFEDSQLLRRLIARRCTYGVDLNPLSVELARLSIWIHTFVPGLPLTLLDRTLVHGNALVGVGTIDEVAEVFKKAGTNLFPVDATSLLGDAKQALRRVAKLADATLKDVEAARSAMEEARVAIGPTKALCDIITAGPLDDGAKRYQFTEWSTDQKKVQSLRVLPGARKALSGLHPLHFPTAFPEVFLRRRAGFDVIVGNPPWQEATVEELAFWARHFPGLRGLPQHAKEVELQRLRRARPDLVEQLQSETDEMARVRQTLTSGAYPGMGTGDPDLYKAFVWRFWNLAAADGGRIGVVLPRSAFAAKGSEDFRKIAFAKAQGVDLTMLLNRAGWVFDEAEHRYTIALAAIARGTPKGETIALRGPYANKASFDAGHGSKGATFEGDDVLGWNDSASLPMLPTDASADVFAQLRKSPRLDLNKPGEWRARPDREMDATNQKDLMTFVEKQPKGMWPVMKGESFDIWEPDNGAESYYAWAEPKAALDWLYAKRLNSGKKKGDSAHSEFLLAFRQDKKSLPFYRPRIAFRDVTRSTDTRCVRAALVPPNVFLTNKAPYLLWPRGDELDQAFLLGVLCSIPLDWYARRFVEVSLNFFIFNPFPVPRPKRSDSRWSRVVATAGRLAAVDARYAHWARAVDVKHGPLPEDEKRDMITELDAVVAHLYGLSEKQLMHIFETFHEGWDYEARLRETLRHFKTLGSKS